MLIVFLGDSITQGLGVSRSGQNYANLLHKKLQLLSSQPIEIMNFGASAMQVNETRMKYEKKLMELQPDIIVFAHGITESIVREHKRYLRFMPKRWRKPGWMDPRPYYSTRKPRRWLEMLESGLRWRVKVTLIKAMGGKPWMHIDDFKQHTMEFTLNLINHNKQTKIILLAPGDIEEKFFPGSSESMEKYRLVLEDIYEKCRPTQRVFMCNSSGYLHKWNDYFEDRFHPNETGHDKIAKALMGTIVHNSLLKYNQSLKEVGG